MQTCQLCGHESERFGQLIDPNNHKWRICADCINGLWEDKQAVNQEISAQQRQAEAIEDVMTLLKKVLWEASNAD